jgi:hypothetical protein
MSRSLVAVAFPFAKLPASTAARTSGNRSATMDLAVSRTLGRDGAPSLLCGASNRPASFMEKTVLIDKSSALNTPINLTSRARERHSSAVASVTNFSI